MSLLLFWVDLSKKRCTILFLKNQSSSNLTQEFLNNCFEFWSVCPPSFFGRKYDHFFSTHPLAFGKMPSHHDWTLSLFSRATSVQWGLIIIEVALWFVYITDYRDIFKKPKDQAVTSKLKRLTQEIIYDMVTSDQLPLFQCMRRMIIGFIMEKNPLVSGADSELSSGGSGMIPALA